MRRAALAATLALAADYFVGYHDGVEGARPTTCDPPTPVLLIGGLTGAVLRARARLAGD